MVPCTNPMLWLQNMFTIVHDLKMNTFWCFHHINQLHMFVFSDLVNMLGSSPGTSTLKHESRHSKEVTIYFISGRFWWHLICWNKCRKEKILLVSHSSISKKIECAFSATHWNFFFQVPQIAQKATCVATGTFVFYMRLVWTLNSLKLIRLLLYHFVNSYRTTMKCKMLFLINV